MRRKTNDEKALQTDRLQDQLGRLQGDLSVCNSSLASANQAEGTAKVAARDAERSLSLALLDKQYLSGEARAAEGRANEHAKASEAASARAHALELRLAQQADLLVGQQLTARQDADQRLEREICRLREDALRDSESQKSRQKEGDEREGRVMREAKQSLEHECLSLKRQLEAAVSEKERISTQLTSVQSLRVCEAAELRAEIRLKSFEANSLGSQLEERAGRLRQQELELETTRGELAAHKAAFVTLERESQAQLQMAQEQLSRANERLALYEAMEGEIDDAVMRTGQQSMGLGGAGLRDDNRSMTAAAAMSLPMALPSRPERRARQAMLLAQKLLEAERQR